jgi:VWFA-related protein
MYIALLTADQKKGAPMSGRKTGTIVRCLLIPFTIIFAAMVIGSCGGGGGSSSGGGGAVVANQPPVVDAGLDQAVDLPAAATLNGTVTDDGLPNPPGQVTTTWSRFSGPGTVIFGNPNAVDTTASFSTAGTYVLSLTAYDGEAGVSDTVTVTVTGAGGGGAVNRKPVVNAGPDQELTLPAKATLNGTVTDDGLPNPPGAVTTTWSRFSGPGDVTFSNPNAVNTTASFSAAGTYVLTLAAYDGEAGAADNVTVTVIAAPTPTPNISLLPEQTDFGVVVLDKSSDKNIQIKNTGNANLAIGQITLPANPFSMISDSCSNAIISPSSSCGLTIRFSPTAQGDYLGSLDIPSNDSKGTVTATLAGKGRALNVSINSVGLVGPHSVQLTVSVTDNDVPVTTLVEGNFSIFENGSPKTIDNFFINIIKPPVSVGMVLDYSSSMGSYTLPVSPVVETAAKSFVDLLDPVIDEAEVIKFATDIAVMVPFTQDHVALDNGIDTAPPFVRSGTGLYNALDNSILSLASRSDLKRRAIVAVSDGNNAVPTPSKTITDVIADAKYNNVQIFTIGIGSSVNNAVMQQLATETGGQYFYNPGADDLEAIYATISEILSNEYTIEYTTSSVAGDTISLKVVVGDGVKLGEYLITVGL